jgi:hypothetical protein
MMLLLYSTLIMIFVRICDSVVCLVGDPIELSSSTLINVNIEQLLNNRSRHERLMCQAWIEFDHVSKVFKLEFGSSMLTRWTRSTENIYTHVITSMIFSNPQYNRTRTSIQTKIELLCYSDDECDRQLILAYFQWLIISDSRQLEHAVRPWILIEHQVNSKATQANLLSKENDHELVLFLVSRLHRTI